MPNIHTPERSPEETREAYALRRELSRAVSDKATLSGDFSPAERSGKSRTPPQAIPGNP